MEQQILATLSLHAKTMVVTCWLETLANKVDLTNWSFTVVYDHRNVLQTLWLQRLFGDPFEQVGWLAQRTGVTRRLNKESRQPESQRSQRLRPQESCD